MESNLDTDYWC